MEVDRDHYSQPKGHNWLQVDAKAGGGNVYVNLSPNEYWNRLGTMEKRELQRESAELDSMGAVASKIASVDLKNQVFNQFKHYRDHLPTVPQPAKDHR